MKPNGIAPDFETLIGRALPCDRCLVEWLWTRWECGGGPKADSCMVLNLALLDPCEDRPEWTINEDGRTVACSSFVAATPEAIAAHDARTVEAAWREAGQGSLLDEATS